MARKVALIRGGLEKQCDGPSVLQRYDGDD